MRRVNFYVTTALSISLLSVPAIASEQGAEATAEDVALFAPLVQPCIAEPESDACAQVRALVAACAAEMEEDKCTVMFEDGDVVFEDPSLVARMQLVLQHVDEVMPEFDSPKPDGLDEDVLEGERIEAETILLLGDENQMTHSSPPIMDDEAEESETETLEDNATTP